MRQALDLLREAIGIETLDRFDDRPVERAPPILQHASVRDLVRERVLERVLEVGEKLRLVHELGGLEVRKAPPQRFLVDLDNRAQKGERNVRPDDRGSLEHALFLRIEPVDARGDDGLHRRRHLQRVGRLHEPVGAALADQRASLDQRAHALLEEKRAALRALDQKPLERFGARIPADERVQKIFGVLRRQRVDVQLA